MRDVVFCSEMLQHLCGWPPFAPVHGFQPLPDPFKRFRTVNQFQQFLIRRRILYDQFGLPVDGQYFRPPGVFQAFHMFLGVPLKIRERVYIVHVHHRPSA